LLHHPGFLHPLRPGHGWPRRLPRCSTPHATTISRAAAKFSLGPFRDAFARWVTSLPQAAEAVDGKTSKQGHDAHGGPVHMLNVFAHELNLCLAQFPVTGGKPTEPQTLKQMLKELLGHDPFIRLFTADALFTQQPLPRVILGADRDYLFVFAVKDSQPDLLEAILTSLGDVAGREPDAKSVEKKGTNSTPGGSGWSKVTRSPTPATRRGSLASR